MKRSLVVLGLVIALTCVLTGTAMAQDSNPGLPGDSSLLFIPTVKNSEENSLSAQPVPEPGWVKYQGPCEADTCPGSYAVRYGQIVAADAGVDFIPSPGGAVFYPASKRHDVRMIYYCFSGEDCLPGVSSPKNVQASAASAWSGTVYTQVDLPPEIGEQAYNKLVSWFNKRGKRYDYVSQPGVIPVYAFRVLAGDLSCDEFKIPSTIPYGEVPVTTVEYKPTGILTCWSSMKQAWELAFIVGWIGVNQNPASPESRAFLLDMTLNRYALVMIGDIKRYPFKVMAHIGQEAVAVVPEMDSTPLSGTRLNFPDWGEMGTALGAGATGIAGGIGWWFGTKALPALDGAMASVMFIVQPDRFMCPTYDASQFDNIPPTPFCGGISIDQ